MKGGGMSSMGRFYCFNTLCKIQDTMSPSHIFHFFLILGRRKIWLIENNAKCSYLKNVLKMVFAPGVYLSEAPSPTRFLFGVLRQFCRFWIWSDLQHNSTTPPPPPPNHTVCLYSTLILGRGGGRWTREKVRGAIVHKAGSKIPTWLTVSPVYKLY